MKCRFCGCTDDKACTYTIAGVVCACYWISPDCCSAPACLRASLRLEKAKLREIPDQEIRRLFRGVA